MRDPRNGRFRVEEDVFNYEHHFPQGDPFWPDPKPPKKDTPAVAKRREEQADARRGDPGTRTERIQAHNELSTAQGVQDVGRVQAATGALNRQLRTSRGQSLFQRKVPFVGEPHFIGNTPEDLIEKAIRKLRGR